MLSELMLVQDILIASGRDRSSPAHVVAVVRCPHTVKVRLCSPTASSSWQLAFKSSLSKNLVFMAVKALLSGTLIKELPSDCMSHGLSARVEPC